MYPGSLPLISNWSLPGHEKLFNVRRCSMYTGVQLDRFHCSMLGIARVSHSLVTTPAFWYVSAVTFFITPFNLFAFLIAF